MTKLCREKQKRSNFQVKTSSGNKGECSFREDKGEISEESDDNPPINNVIVDPGSLIISFPHYLGFDLILSPHGYKMAATSKGKKKNVYIVHLCLRENFPSYLFVPLARARSHIHP